MIKIAILFALLAIASAGYLAAPTLLHTGTSSQFRTQDNLGNYVFGYDENHSTGGTFRKESGDAYGSKVGSYGLRDADGRLRIVSYIADGLGFRASISSNEPGTALAPSASTIHSPLVAAAPAVIAAPAFAAPAYAGAPAYAASYASPTYAYGLAPAYSSFISHAY